MHAEWKMFNACPRRGVDFTPATVNFANYWSGRYYEIIRDKSIPFEGDYATCVTDTYEVKDLAEQKVFANYRGYVWWWFFSYLEIG